jgi:hypothetical protein
MTNYVEILENQRVKAAEAGFAPAFNAHISSPLVPHVAAKPGFQHHGLLDAGLLGLLAAPSVYHMATGREADEGLKDKAEVIGLGGLAAHDLLRGNH